MKSDALAPAKIAESRDRPCAVARGPWSAAVGPLAALAALLASACVDSTGPPFPLIEATEFAPSLGVDLTQMTRTGGGIYLLDLEIGAGEALQLEDRVIVSYSLHLADGTLAEQRDSVSFRLGCRQLVAGLEAGIRGMHVDGRRRIVVPGRLGYGRSPPRGLAVPFGAILVFEIEAQFRRPIFESPCSGIS